MKPRSNPNEQPPATAPPKGRWFVLFAAGVLLVTTIFWAALAARLQAANADQLIDSYLFESAHTFRTATFPGAHTFLLKWPLFALSAVFGGSVNAILVLTILCALLPVAMLAVVLYKIERRPVLCGLWYLALALCLLVAPAQPAPGVLLPVNFGMLATRNIEYVLFGLVGWLLIRSHRLRDRYSLAAIAASGLLLASDKLFVPLLVGAVSLLLAVRYVWPRSSAAYERRRYGRWLVTACIGVALSYGIIAVLTPLVSISSQAQPYQFVTQPKVLVQALAYAGTSFLTLFGANPIHEHLALAGTGPALRGSFKSLTIISYAVNALLVIAMIGLSLRLLLSRKRLQDAPRRLLVFSAFMLTASLVATGLYVGTSHYYPVDSRYIAMWLLALPLVAALGLRSVAVPRRLELVVLGVLIAAMPLAMFTSYRQYQASDQAGKPQRQFQQAVAVQLNRYHAAVVMGDYWDVTPIRSLVNYRPAIVPLAQCDQAQQALSSTAWRQAAVGDTIAYVSNSQPSPTGFQACSGAAVQAQFGTPSRVIPITTAGHAGSSIYLYEHGVNAIVRSRPTQWRPSYVMPALSSPARCRQDTTLTIVAHEDDDILFMNPDVQTALDHGQCLTAVYLTAGDAGQGASYWLGRRAGAQAAYARMLNRPDRWVTQQRRVDGRLIDTAVLVTAPYVRLVFLNLPDGDLDGSGFASTNYASLVKLRRGAINALPVLGSDQIYTSEQLIETLRRLMDIYQPKQVLTQNFSNNLYDGDHSDHHATGYFARQAFDRYDGAGELKSYMGYPIAGLPQNVSSAALDRKEAAFFAYGAHDGGTCDNERVCDDSTVYGRYLIRQYSRVVARHVLPKRLPPAVDVPFLPKSKPQAPLQPGHCIIGGSRQLIYCASRL